VGANPSSGADRRPRHLLPQGEKEPHLRAHRINQKSSLFGASL
jgi:hypothetical protein